MTYDYLQWLRFVQVIVGKKGEGLDLRASHSDGLRIEFTVDKTIRHTPNTADITIYNLHPDDEHRVLKEYDDVMINAGYAREAPKDPMDIAAYHVLQVFRGNLKHSFAYWDAPDRKVDIQAADGDRDFRNAILNVPLPAGSSDADVVDAALKAMSHTSKGHIETSSRKLIRGKVILEPARDALHKVAHNNSANWSIQDGFLQIVGAIGVLPDEAIVLNAETGLLGAPEMSDTGIQVTSLLNPLIGINGRLLLDNNNIKVQSFQLYSSGPKVRERKLVRLSPDGVYKVFKLRHECDSRGPAKTISHCIALGDAIPSTSHKAPAVRI